MTGGMSLKLELKALNDTEVLNLESLRTNEENWDLCSRVSEENVGVAVKRRNNSPELSVEIEIPSWIKELQGGCDSSEGEKPW